MIKALLLGIGMLCLVQNVASQVSESELEEKYWNYRERQRMKYVKLDWDNGGGIPISIRDYKYKCGDVTGIIYSGDIGMEMGFYLGMLALEYSNLTKAGQNTDATLYELYYAINSLTRIDGNAEPYFRKVLDKDTNGFFIRGDYPINFYEDWEKQGDYVHMISSHGGAGVNPNSGEVLDSSILEKTIDGITYDYKLYEYESTYGLKYNFVERSDKPILDEYKRCAMTNVGLNPFTNEQTRPEHKDLSRGEMSQDQIIGILFGLSFVKKFIPPNTYVKPTQVDRGFDILYEIDAIALRYLTYLSSFRVKSGYSSARFPTYSLSNNCEFWYASKINWFLTNPTSQSLVSRGATNYVYPYPIYKTCERLIYVLPNNSDFTTGTTIKNGLFTTTPSNCHNFNGFPINLTVINWTKLTNV